MRHWLIVFGLDGQHERTKDTSDTNSSAKSKRGASGRGKQPH